MNHAGAGLGEQRNLAIVEENRVGEPDIGSEPVDRGGEIDRSHAVDAVAISPLVEIFGEMRMQMDTLVRARELGGFLHQAGRHRERRTGRQDDPAHRMAAWIVVLMNQAFRVLQDGVFLLHATVRQQPALALAARHGAAWKRMPVSWAARISLSRRQLFGRT